MTAVCSLVLTAFGVLGKGCCSRGVTGAGLLGSRAVWCGRRRRVARQDKMTDQVREPQFPPGRAAGRGRGWYRGDCHVHSARSQGGELTPEQLAAAARAGGLDFIAITEHNTADTHGAWGQLAGDDLLVILGQEVTTLTGHWLALGIGPGQVVEWRYGVRHGVIGRYLSQVRQAGGLCVAAHPHAPYPGGVFMYPFDGFDAVEVWNGLWSSAGPGMRTTMRRWPNGGGRWPPASAAGGGCPRSAAATPTWTVRSPSRRPSCWPMSWAPARSWPGSGRPQLDRRISRGRPVPSRPGRWPQRRNRRAAGNLRRAGRGTDRGQRCAVRHGQLSYRPGHGPERITARRGTGHHRMAHQRRGIRVRQGRGTPTRTADGGTYQSHNPVLNPPMPGVRRQRPGAVRTGGHRSRQVAGCGCRSRRQGGWAARSGVFPRV